MFQDQLTRNSQNNLSWYIGWERYAIFTSLVLGLVISSSVQQLLTLDKLPDGEPVCSSIHFIAEYTIIIASLHLGTLFGFSCLRDRSVSLQVRPTLIAKILAIIAVVFGGITEMVLTGMVTKELKDYAHTSVGSGSSQFLVIDGTTYYCPAIDQYFFVTAMILVAWIFLSNVWQILATLWIIFQRAVFLFPTPGTWDDPEEIKALNWICTEYGDVIPTIYMLPPSVHRQHREVNMCMLYSHGNAMDLADTVYTLRALAETFDCAVFGYEYPGYGMCSGSTSEERCYAAIAASFQCLVDYHKLQPRQIILFGRSLGTGPSTHFASRQGKSLGGLILQSPLMSVIRTQLPCVQRTLPFDMFCSIDKIQDVEVPTFIMHGRKDTMVPFTHGEALWNKLQPQYRCPPLWIDDASHNDMPRPWIVTEDHVPDETEEEHQEKLRRNKEARIFIAKCREYLVVVRTNKEQLDKEDALAKAERKAKKELQKQEELKKLAEVVESLAGKQPNDLALELKQIELAVMGNGQMNGNGISTNNLIGTGNNSSSAGDESSSNLVDHTNDKDDGPSSYTGPIHVVGGKQGEAQFKHLYNNLPSKPIPTLSEALGILPADSARAHQGTSSNTALPPSSSAKEREALLGPDAGTAVRSSHRGGGGAGGGHAPTKQHHTRQGSLRFSDQHHLSPSASDHPHQLSASPKKYHHHHHSSRTLETGGGGGSVLSAPVSIIGSDSAMKEHSLVPESPDASRRPSLTENMLSMNQYTMSMVSQGGERNEQSQVGSITYNPTNKDRDRFERFESRADSRFGDAEPSRLGGFEMSRLGDRDRDRDRDRERRDRDRADSRVGAPEVSRIGGETQQKLHSVAVRRGDARGRGERAGHSPQSMSRSISISNSMQSPLSFYSHIPIATIYTQPPSNIPLPSGSMLSSSSNSETNTATVTASSSPALQSQSIPHGSHHAQQPSSGHVILPTAALATSSAPSTPILASKSVSSMNLLSPESMNLNSTTGGGSSGPGLFSPLTTHATLYSPQTQPTTISTPLLGPGSIVPVGTGVFSPATILAPNPALVPLSMAQLQELMDQLKQRDRAEREKFRSRERERENDESREELLPNSIGGSSSSSSLLRKPPLSTTINGGVARENSISSRDHPRKHRTTSISSSATTTSTLGNGRGGSPLTTTDRASPITLHTPPHPGNLPPHPTKDATDGVRVELSDYSSANPVTASPAKTRSVRSSAVGGGGGNRSSISSNSSSVTHLPRGGSPLSTTLRATSPPLVSSSTISTTPPPATIRVQIHTPNSGGNRNGLSPRGVGLNSEQSPITSTTGTGGGLFNRASLHVGPAASSASISPSPTSSSAREHREKEKDKPQPPTLTQQSSTGAESARGERAERGERERDRGERVSQHRGGYDRESVSGQYDHPSVLSRSRSGTSRSRWPYSQTDYTGTDRTVDMSDHDGLTQDGVGQGGVGEYDIEEEEIEVADHSTLQLDLTPQTETQQPQRKPSAGSAKEANAMAASSPSTSTPPKSMSDLGPALPPLAVVTPVTSKNPNLTTKNVIVQSGSIPNTPSALERQASKRLERQSSLTPAGGGGHVSINASPAPSPSSKVNGRSHSSVQQQLIAAASAGGAPTNSNAAPTPSSSTTPRPGPTSTNEEVLSSSPSGVVLSHQTFTYQPSSRPESRESSVSMTTADGVPLLEHSPVSTREPDDVVAAILQPISDRQLSTSSISSNHSAALNSTNDSAK